MKSQIKVKNVQKYSDGQSEHTVHKGKFLLIDPEWVGNDQQPIIISETEEIEDKDWVYDERDHQIFECIGENYSERFYYHKILALPEQFSEKHLQAIVDGKMKDGDEVLVKCIRTLYDEVGYDKKSHIHLNKQNHITLFSVKEHCPECGSFHINIRHSQRWDGTTVKWKECDLCSEIIDNTSKQSSESLNMPKDLFQKWINRLDSFEYDVNQQCDVKEEMEEWFKHNQ